MAKIDLNQAAEQYFTRIHRAALVLTGNPWDADDLAQETFLVVARKPDQFQNRSSLYTWLYGILLNLERRQRRRFGLHRRKLTVLWQRQPTRELAAPPAESPLEAAEWKRSLWAIVAELSAGQRQALVLRFSEHLPYHEIAEAMDCPVGTVKSRIFHGLAALRDLLTDENDAFCPPAYPSEDIHHAI